MEGNGTSHDYVIVPLNILEHSCMIPTKKLNGATRFLVKPEIGEVSL